MAERLHCLLTAEFCSIFSLWPSLHFCIAATTPLGCAESWPLVPTLELIRFSRSASGEGTNAPFSSTATFPDIGPSQCCKPSSKSANHFVAPPSSRAAAADHCSCSCALRHYLGSTNRRQSQCHESLSTIFCKSKAHISFWSCFLRWVFLVSFFSNMAHAGFFFRHQFLRPVANFTGNTVGKFVACDILLRLRRHHQRHLVNEAKVKRYENRHRLTCACDRCVVVFAGISEGCE